MILKILGVDFRFLIDSLEDNLLGPKGGEVEIGHQTFDDGTVQITANDQPLFHPDITLKVIK